jgi:WD40 repeat protein
VQAGGLLVSAGEDGLQVWDWAQLRGAGAEGRVEPVARLRGGAAEVNALALDAARQQLWAGLGDGALQLWDLPTRRLLAQQETAHVDAVLALAFRAYTSQLFSAGEDGLLRVWDVRAPPAQPLRVLDPLTGAAPASSARRSRGGWLGALELDASGEWLACGGGARVASVLHAGSLACTALLPCAGAVHALCFDAEARLLAAGAFSALQVFTRDGRLYSLVPTQLSATFTLALNVASPRRRLLALAGLAPRIDLYAPPDYATRHSAFVLTPPRPAP